MALNVERFIAANIAMEPGPKFRFSAPVSGIPIPPIPYGSKRIRKVDVLRNMEVGQSRFFAGAADVRGSWQALASYLGKQNGWVFECRKVREADEVGVRIWRTA
jgi:hypothetical protein